MFCVVNSRNYHINKT